MSLWDALKSVSAAFGSKSLTINQSIQWTGYTNVKDRNLLIDAICETYDRAVIRPEGQGVFYPEGGRTFCNLVVSEIAEKMGCHDLNGLMANDICDLVSASSNWKKVLMQDTQAMANLGTFILAVQKDSPHGHVCVVRPGKDKFSGRYGKVPSVMNVGKDVAISKGVNWAFRDLPDFYAWGPSI